MRMRWSDANNNKEVRKSCRCQVTSMWRQLSSGGRYQQKRQVMLGQFQQFDVDVEKSNKVRFDECFKTWICKIYRGKHSYFEPISLYRFFFSLSILKLVILEKFWWFHISDIHDEFHEKIARSPDKELTSSGHYMAWQVCKAMNSIN